MPSFREQTTTGTRRGDPARTPKGPRDRRVGRVRASGDDRRGTEDLRRGRLKGPQRRRRDEAASPRRVVFAFARELSDNVIGGLSHDDLSASGSGSKSRRLSFKGMGTKVATQMLPDGMKALAHPPVPPWSARSSSEILLSLARSRSRSWTCFRPSSTLPIRSPICARASEPTPRQSSPRARPNRRRRTRLRKRAG